VKVNTAHHLVEDARVVTITALLATGRILADDQGHRVELLITATAVETFVLTTTRPHFGGRRWWIVCPCGRRVAALYGAAVAGSYRCRTCARLVYTSQRETASQRLLRRADKLRARLGEGGLWPVPRARRSRRPRGMWRRTYWRLCEAAERLDDQLGALLMRPFSSSPS
jgi:hypothetical protein